MGQSETLKKVRVAIGLSETKVSLTFLNPARELEGAVEIDGIPYQVVGGNHVCGFYGTLQSNGEIIGCEINLFGDFNEAWSVLKKFKGVVFVENVGQVRVVWAEVGREIIAGQEEWFQECALLRAEPGVYCIVLDFPGSTGERLVREQSD